MRELFPGDSRLGQVADRAAELSPRDRYQSAAELGRAVECEGDVPAKQWRFRVPWLPGFRSGNPKKMVPAALWYGAALALSFSAGGIEQGEMDLGISMTSAIAQGLDGTAKWTGGKKMENVRGLLPLYPSYMTVYTLASSPIKTLKDFKGHIVGLGSKGAAMDAVFREALPRMDAAPASVFNDGHSATATAVGQGQVDAALLFSLM